MKDKIILGLFLTISILFIGLPLLNLFFNTFGSSHDGSKQVLDALIISLKSTGLTLLIVVLIGTPTAYAVARLHFPGKGILDLILNLPLVLPPAVAGLLLLLTFGKQGIIGRYLYAMGIQIPFTLTAVIMAQLFVALPMYIKTTSEGFKKVGIHMELTAMTLGDSKWRVFFRVVLPLAKGSLMTGAIMAWARALAEFGATIMFAGNLAGRTQTLTLAIYSAMETDIGVALYIAQIMVLVSITLLISVHLLSRRRS